MYTKGKLELLKVAYDSGISNWSYDEKVGELIGTYDTEEYFQETMPECTRFWVDIHDDGHVWVHCQDQWPDGNIFTGIVELCEL